MNRWERASPGTLRHLAETERNVADRFRRWAAEAEAKALAYEALAATRERARRAQRTPGYVDGGDH